MRFLDGVNVTYIKKSEKEKYSKVLREISKSGTSLEFRPVNGKDYGHYRIEFYEPTDKLPTMKVIGFLTQEAPLDWLMSLDNQSEITLNDVFHVVGTEIIEVNQADFIHSVVIEQYKVYSIINKEKTQGLTVNELVKLTLEKMFEVYFDEKFNEEEYDIEVHPELTDYFV